MMGLVMMHDFSRVALVLISLGLGYMVCVRAAALNKGRLKVLGYIIGTVIIVGAVTMIGTKAVKAVRCASSPCTSCSGRPQAGTRQMMPPREQAPMFNPADIVGDK